MIKRIKLLRNLGVFDNVSVSSELKRIVLIYAENGSGKTTLAEILRSLETGDISGILKKRRFTTSDKPHIILECDGEPPVTFKDDTWNSTNLRVKVFDEVFIDNNVYSGLDVGSEHRKNLHDFVLGEQGVALSRRKKDLGSKILEYNRAIKEAKNAVPDEQRLGFSMDQFCALPKIPNIEAEIANARGVIGAFQDVDTVRQTPEFTKIHLPFFDKESIGQLLQRDLHDLNEDVATKARKHMESLGHGGESWVAEGMKHIAKHDKTCPFCGQNTDGLSLIEYYRAYFSEAYENLKSSISSLLDEIQDAHSNVGQATFERTVGANKDLEHFWARYCDERLPNIDTKAIINDWTSALNEIVRLLEAKQDTPLEQISWDEDILSSYERHIRQIADVNHTLDTYNNRINKLKHTMTTSTVSSATGNLTRLEAIRERHSPMTAGWCEKYIEARDAKISANKEKDQVTEHLNTYRDKAFPTLQTEVNRFLSGFNVRFTIQGLKATNILSGSSCKYNVGIDNTPIGTGKPKLPTDPSIGDTLSTGDRNTLALAFFFSSLIKEGNLDNTVVAVDDPVSSLDEHRSLTTVQELRKLSNRVGQLIILSHSKSFLFRILKRIDRSECLFLKMVHAGKGSTIQKWDIDRASNSEQSRQQSLLEKYAKDKTGNPQDVAKYIRPFLEAFLEVSCAAHYVSGESTGTFLNECKQKVGTDDEILNGDVISELQDILEYAHKFQHNSRVDADGNINTDELQGYVRRTLNIVKPTMSKAS